MNTHERHNLPNVGFSEGTPFEPDINILLGKLDTMDIWEQLYNLRNCFHHDKQAFWSNKEVFKHIERLHDELFT